MKNSLIRKIAVGVIALTCGLSSLSFAEDYPNLGKSYGRVQRARVRNVTGVLVTSQPASLLQIYLSSGANTNALFEGVCHSTPNVAAFTYPWLSSVTPLTPVMVSSGPSTQIIRDLLPNFPSVFAPDGIMCSVGTANTELMVYFVTH